MTDTEYIDPTANPAAANADLAAIVSDGGAGKKPVMPLPADTYVRLPGGLLLDVDADPVYDVEVQELTGEHEEAIARAKQSGRTERFYMAILESGVAKIGGKEPTREALDAMLVGDQDFLLREIRRATYGDTLEFPDRQCPWCGGTFDLEMPLDDIDVKRLDSAEESYFTVPLRKGRSAYVRLPQGADRDAMVEDSKMTVAEQNTILLSRCVLSITDEHGEKETVARQTQPVRRLSIVDRRTLLDEIGNRQPGPQYERVSFVHDACEKEVPFPVGLGEMFLDL